VREAASLRWASVGFLVLLVPNFAWGQYLAMPGPGPIAPAPDFPAYFAPSNETLDPPPPRGYAVDIRKAKEEAASMIGVAPGTVQYDRGASAGTGWAEPSGQFSVEQEREATPAAPAQITSFNGISYTGFIPPDPVLAAGPANLVLSTNGSVTIRDKAGALVAPTTLASFFSSVRATGENTLFDPRVVFDTRSSRFFLSAVGKNTNTTCTAGTCVSHFLLAVSKTSSPATTGSGDWFFYAFDATLDGSTPTTNWADYPSLGVDSSVVVLTANMFSFSAGKFQRAKIRIFDKSVLIAGGAVTWIDFVGMTDPVSGFPPSTIQPALTFGSPGIFFLVSASRTLNSCNLVVWGIQNPLSSPTLSSKLATAGGMCAVPPDAQQLGGGTPLDTGGTRLLNAVSRNNSLWTAHSILANFGSGNVAAIRWVQLDVNAWPSAVSFIQDATFGADQVWSFYPAVMVDASNNLALVFARSSASELGSARYTGRLATDPANTLQPSALLKAGTATYLNLDSSKRNRWGDYLGIGLDPSDGSVWVLGEYAATSTTWGTWVGQFEFAAALSVSVSGNGTVTSSPAGISCPGTCTASFTGGTTVTLSATPSGGSTFGGWGGDCVGQGNPCTLTMNGPKTVTATFNPPPSPPQGFLDAPAANATVSAPVPVFGWAIDSATPSARLTLTLVIDGTPVSASFAQGGARPDVCALFPETSFPGACSSGFNTIWNPGGLTGTHTVGVQVTNGAGLSTLLGPVSVTLMSGPATATVTLNGSAFRTGQTITYQAALTPGSTLIQVDVYLGVLLPDGVTFLSLVQLSSGFISIALGPSPIPFRTNVTLTPTVVPFSYAFAGFEPVGMYSAHAIIALAGSDPLQPANQLSRAVQAFQFTP